MTGYTDSRYTKTEICSKCEGLKTWNYWYHTNEDLCDDCSYVTGKYYKLTKEQAITMEMIGEFNVGEFVLLEKYHRRKAKVRLTVKMFNEIHEEINNFGYIYIDLDNKELIEEVRSHHFGNVNLSKEQLEELKVLIVSSRAFFEAKKSYKKVNV